MTAHIFLAAAAVVAYQSESYVMKLHRQLDRSPAYHVCSFVRAQLTGMCIPRVKL